MGANAFGIDVPWQRQFSSRGLAVSARLNDGGHPACSLYCSVCRKHQPHKLPNCQAARGQASRRATDDARRSR